MKKSILNKLSESIRKKVIKAETRLNEIEKEIVEIDKQLKEIKDDWY